jgi:hypothetical protein
MGDFMSYAPQLVASTSTLSNYSGQQGIRDDTFDLAFDASSLDLGLDGPFGGVNLLTPPVRPFPSLPPPPPLYSSIHKMTDVDRGVARSVLLDLFLQWHPRTKA